MINNLMTPENIALRLPITSQAIQFAEQFSQQQPTPAKQERVLLNTLAVCIIDNYLETIGFRTNLAGGDSWNPISRMCANVADLEVSGIGKLECLPVKAGATEYSIPAEVWIDRVGYLFIEIDLAIREATILGFTPQARAVVNLNQLRSPEDLIDRLHSLMTTPVVQLDRWFESLENALIAGWQNIEYLFTTPELAFRSVNTARVTNEVRRGKVIDLGIQLQEHTIALLVELSPVENDERTQIWLKVCPTNQDYLLPNIQLIAIDESEQIFLQAQSRAADNRIQLAFKGNPGEKFGVTVKLDNVEITEQFMI
jgi:Protein of unknown function (DUF1822)